MSETVILNSSQISRKLDRISYEIIEDNFDQTEIILVGLEIKGKIIADRICKKINDSSNIRASVISINLHSNDYEHTLNKLENKSVVLIDDILNTGKNMFKALYNLFPVNVHKIRTAVLINRSHKLFPINVDFFGLELSTIKEEYIHVKLNELDNTDLAVLKWLN